ncbi:biotin/lipoyl-binding protein, partial [Vibrio parahaemolyticus]|nr:biotin/lipoyl-binding protein [Vibrio parahaemolyticus]
GNIFKVNVQQGAEVAEGDVILILEAMKMETEVRAALGGIVQELNVKEGDAVTVGAPLLSLAYGSIWDGVMSFWSESGRAP